MRIRAWLCVVAIFWLTALTANAGDCPRDFVEELLIAEGLDASEAQSIMQDPRIDVRPDIVIKNLFFSSPKGDEEQPLIMRIDPRQIDAGRVFMQDYAGTLAVVGDRFGVSPSIITAILIVESRLGTYPMPYSVATAYANLAFLLHPDYFSRIQSLYADAYPQLQEEATIARAKRRARWALGELFYLSQIAQHLEIDPLEITGSFAGALGPAPFIPSSFWIFGQDGDGDGVADPFNLTDAMFSMGHYLKKYGWRENAPTEQKRKAVWYYNRSQVYVNTIMMLYDKLQTSAGPS